MKLKKLDMKNRKKISIVNRQVFKKNQNYCQIKEVLPEKLRNEKKKKNHSRPKKQGRKIKINILSFKFYVLHRFE